MCATLPQQAYLLYSSESYQTLPWGPSFWAAFVREPLHLPPYSQRNLHSSNVVARLGKQGERLHVKPSAPDIFRTFMQCSHV